MPVLSRLERANSKPLKPPEPNHPPAKSLRFLPAHEGTIGVTREQLFYKMQLSQPHTSVRQLASGSKSAGRPNSRRLEYRCPLRGASTWHKQKDDKELFPLLPKVTHRTAAATNAIARHHRAKLAIAHRLKGTPSPTAEGPE